MDSAIRTVVVAFRIHILRISRLIVDGVGCTEGSHNSIAVSRRAERVASISKSHSALKTVGRDGNMSVPFT